MKKIITTTAFLFVLLTNASAQGNLQFNQVINGELTALVAYSTTLMGTITVPAGKVWKIESTSLLYDGGATFYTDGNPVFINNHLVWQKSSNNLSSSQLPLWLSAGTYNVRANGSDNTLIFSYSVIEFNVVP